ncbi:rhodanese-like domain-containing protein [Nocardioides sp. Bht2]|uniref:rhodanese-like domain-containing protein n=1 Tax=Nocardioides sp. Bht2 TaxID=3392297 RepID=UPI0039B45446
MTTDHHTAETRHPMSFEVIALDTPTLGDRSYLVHDGHDAFVIDPQRDLDRVENLLAEHQVRLLAVFETHIHNDYVTGGFALAERHQAKYYVNAVDPVSFARTPISDGETVAIGTRMRITAVATPGHTFTHLAFALHDAADQIAEATALFSGGSLLYGATGRPDLLGAAHAEQLAHHQHASAHRIADLLPGDTDLYPTHGFGSFCSATQSDATASTVGIERNTNPALTQDAASYVRDLLAGLDAWPAYYVHMAPQNATGPAAADLTLPHLADAAEIEQRIHAGEWVVDLRNRTAFAAGHTPGALNFGSDGALATYLGWLIPWGTPLTLLGESEDQVGDAIRELSRIGVTSPAAHATGGPADWSSQSTSHPTATFADLADVRSHRPVHLLDVRRAGEFATAHLRDATNIPLHELMDRIDEVPDGEVWVHCAGGYRASIAASILAASGRRPVAIDDAFDNAAAPDLVSAR